MSEPLVSVIFTSLPLRLDATRSPVIFADFTYSVSVSMLLPLIRVAPVSSVTVTYGLSEADDL